MFEVIADALGGLLIVAGAVCASIGVVDHLRSGTKKAVVRLPWRTRRRMSRTRRAHEEAKAALENAYKYKADRRIEERQAWRNEFEGLLRPLCPAPKTTRQLTGYHLEMSADGHAYPQPTYGDVHLYSCECFDCSAKNRDSTDILDAIDKRKSQGGTI